MKEKLILAVIALALGLLGGYFLFGTRTAENGVEPHDHAGATADETWTCSMHPQIRQSEPGDCPICGMDLIPLGSQANSDPTVLEMTEAAVALANVQTTVLGTTTSSDDAPLRRLSGKVQADERRAASQVAHIPGRIERLYVTFTGERVTRGQRLADIYSPDLISAQRELLEARKLRDVNPELVAAARDKLRYWKIDSATIAAIERAGEIREVFPVFADAAGVVDERLVAVGDYVQRGEPLFALVNLERVWVLFDAFEEDLSRIDVGDRLRFTTPALPGRSFETRVSFIDPTLDAETRTVAIRTEINNPRGALKPGMLVYGQLRDRAAATAVLTVPKSAVLWTGTRSVVYVKIPDATVPTFQFREVTLGESRGDRYVVLDGLQTGEEVVIYGNFAIDAAAQLNNQRSMMNRSVTVSGAVTEVVPPSFAEETPLAFQAQLGRLVAAYLPVKDALVASEVAAAGRAATALSKSLDGMDASLLRGDALRYWQERQRALAAHARQLAAATDLTEQREQFEFLSDALIRAVRAFGSAGQPVYVQHCPMAFDNRGADWLAADSAVRNPYFGEAMLTCGYVVDAPAPAPVEEESR